MADVKNDLREKIKGNIAYLKEELNTVRAGRANPLLLDKVLVEYYGTPTPLKNMANVSIPDPRTLVITPFDPKAIVDIEKAINISDLGMPPSNDGKVVRLTVPEITEERRKELTKVVRKMGEDTKVAVRNERRDANDFIKKMEKNGEISENEMRSEAEEIQKITDEAMKDIDGIIKEKETEILEV